MTPLLFLDIDGVLNSHDANEYRINSIHRDKIARLNQIVQATGAEIVISSAWRYMILGAAMTLDGFRYMLVTHGLAPFVKIIGHTKSDEQIPERGDQITDYLTTFGWRPYAVLDDGSEDSRPEVRSMSESLRHRHGARWVNIDGAIGLADTDVVITVATLTRPLP